MRIRSRIFAVGAIPIAIAACIALAAILLLNEANRSRSSAIIAGTVFRTLLTAVAVRNEFIQAAPGDRAPHARHFLRVAGRARDDLKRLARLARPGDEAIEGLGRAFAAYVDSMDRLVAVTTGNDTLIANMTERANALVTLTDPVRPQPPGAAADPAPASSDVAMQTIAIEALKLNVRTSEALFRRDERAARAILAESETLPDEIDVLAVTPPVRTAMLEALNRWRDALRTTADGLAQQNALLRDMDTAAGDMIDTARSIDTRFSQMAEANGRWVGMILLFGAAVGLLLGGAAATIVARSITQPLQHLQSRMVQLARRPDAAPLGDSERRDELGDMARATNMFLAEIARREGAINAARERADEALLTLQKTQAELIQAEKMASLGQLVAGVAHEINTPIGVALTTATVIDEETRQFIAATRDGRISRGALTRLVERVSEGSTLLGANLARAADLIQSFKHVATDQASGERRSFEVRAWLGQLLTSLGPMLRKAGHAATIDSPAGLMLDSYPGVLAQVVTNLVVNASLHAFEPGAIGQIAITVEETAGEMLRLTVRDDGRGIPAENRGRIFDPFFTTRRSAGSTGLGLHIVYNLVTSTLQGRIHCESAPGSGTAFMVDLPRALKTPPQKAAREPNADV